MIWNILLLITQSIINIQGEDYTFICHKNVALYKNGTYYASIKIFNSLPKYINDIVKDTKYFVRLLRIF